MHCTHQVSFTQANLRFLERARFSEHHKIIITTKGAILLCRFIIHPKLQLSNYRVFYCYKRCIAVIDVRTSWILDVDLISSYHNKIIIFINILDHNTIFKFPARKCYAIQKMHTTLLSKTYCLWKFRCVKIVKG